MAAASPQTIIVEEQDDRREPIKYRILLAIVLVSFGTSLFVKAAWNQLLYVITIVPEGCEMIDNFTLLKGLSTSFSVLLFIISYLSLEFKHRRSSDSRVMRVPLVYLNYSVALLSGPIFASYWNYTHHLSGQHRAVVIYAFSFVYIATSTIANVVLLELTCRRSPHFSGRRRKKASSLIIHSYLLGQSLTGILLSIVGTIQRKRCSYLNCSAVVGSMDEPNYFPRDSANIPDKQTLMVCQNNLVNHLRFSVGFYLMFTELVIFVSFVGFVYLHRRLHSGKIVKRASEELDEHHQFIVHNPRILHFDLTKKAGLVVVAMIAAFLTDGFMPLFEHYSAATAGNANLKIVLVNLASFATAIGVIAAIVLRLIRRCQSMGFAVMTVFVGALIATAVVVLSAVFRSKQSNSDDIVILILLVIQRLLMEFVKAQSAMKVHSTARKQLMFWLGALEELSSGIGLILSFFTSRYAYKFARIRTPCNLVCDLATENRN